MNNNFHKVIFLFSLIVFSVCCVKSQSNDLVLNEENHDIYFKKASDLIFPQIQLHDRKVNSSLNKEKDLREGIRYLDAVIKINPNNFAAFWFKGKAYQALEDSENAYIQFKEAFKLKSDNPDVARELMIECLNLGKNKEGVEVALHALNLSKENAGLLGNLSLAYLMNKELNLAKETIEKAIVIDPKDKINISLKKNIIELIE